MRTFLRGMLPFAVAIALVAGSTPASAAKPLVEIFENEGWFTLPQIACSGFNLTEEMVSEQIRMTTYFDRDGNAIEIVVHARFEGIITNDATGEEFRDHSVFTESTDQLDGTVTVSGPSFHYIRAGSGQVYAEVGHKIILDNGTIEFQAGQDDFAQTEELESLCPAFA